MTRNRTLRDTLALDRLDRVYQASRGSTAPKTIAQIGARATDALDRRISAVDESAETLPELEDENFTIDTTGWREELRTFEGGIKRSVKVSPAQDGLEEGAVTEYVDEDGNKVQHFTWEAAEYYVKKVGKRMPTKEEWEGLMEAGKTKDMPLSGIRNWNNGPYNFQGTNGYYWSSSPNGAYSYSAYFNVGGGNIASNANRAGGFAVRCVKR